MKFIHHWCPQCSEGQLLHRLMQAG
jgi:uncharacterized protein (DUF983 family)